MTRDERLKILQADFEALRVQVEKLEGLVAPKELRPYQPEWVKPDGE